MTTAGPPGPGLIRIRRALLSVTDLRGLFELATALDGLGVALVATRGTWVALGTEGLLTTPLADQVRPLLGGRLTTLFPEVHAAIAARDDDEVAALAAAGLAAIDLVICNPRRFAISCERPDGTLAMATEDIDDGGVALIRAGARNHARVAVVVDPDDYPALVDELAGHGGALTAVTRLRLAGKAFAATAAHDAAVAGFLADVDDEAAAQRDAIVTRPRLRARRTGPGTRAALAIDEPSDAALYVDPPPALGIVVDDRATLAAAMVIGGAALPATVVRDLDRALALVRELGAAAAVIARGDEPVAASAIGHPAVALRHVLAWAAETESLAGASLALDGPLTAALAALVAGTGLAAAVVAEVAADVVAAWPDAGPRLVVAPGRWRVDPSASAGLAPLAVRSVAGGLLVQEVDVAAIDAHHATAVTARGLEPDERRDLALAARVARHVRAHALVVADVAGTVAIVGGQPDLRRALAVARAQLGDFLDGCVAAVSARIDDPVDVEAMAQAGIVALYQPGGSARDQEVVAAADRHRLAMALSGLEHVRG